MGSSNSAHKQAPVYDFLTLALRCIVKSSIWGRDSHGLFDYDDKSVRKLVLRVNQSSKSPQFNFIAHLVRSNDFLRIQDEAIDQQHTSNENNHEQEQSVRVVQTEGSYWIYHSEHFDPDEDYLQATNEKLWRVIRYSKLVDSENGHGYRIKHNDLLKIGRVRFKVV